MSCPRDTPGCTGIDCSPALGHSCTGPDAPRHADMEQWCPYKGCPVRGGTGLHCNDDHCRELRELSYMGDDPNMDAWDKGL